MADLTQRVKLRFLEGEEVPSDEVIEEITRTVSDRLAMRLEVESIPPLAESIVVDASMKALRLRGYEGSASESAGDGGSVSSSFVTAILDEYSEEVEALRRTLNGRGIKFMGGRRRR